MAADEDVGPPGAQAAVDRYRDIAKYLITIFAGVGAVLVAGTQLASIGALSLDDAPDRVAAVAIGLMLAVAAIAALVALVLKVLLPVEMTFDLLRGNAKLVKAINDRPALLGGAEDVEDLHANLHNTAFSDDERASWETVRDIVVSHAAFLKMQASFQAVWWPVLGAATLGVIGITLFAWGANPPKDSGSGPVVSPKPVPVSVTLTDSGKQALAEPLGNAECAEGAIDALAIGGSEGAPQVVTVPSGDCKSVRFVLGEEFGVAVARVPAPTK